MRYEYIIKKPEQTICIEVSIYCDYSKIEYRVSDIGVKSKGKRKFEFVAARLRDDHGYRHTDYDKRSDYVKNEYPADPDIRCGYPPWRAYGNRTAQRGVFRGLGKAPVPHQSDGAAGPAGYHLCH